MPSHSGSDPGKESQAHERAGNGNPVAARQTGQLLCGPAEDDAAARHDQGLLRPGEHFQDIGHFLGRRFVEGFVIADPNGGRIVIDLRGHDVLGQIHQHRPRPAGAGDMEGFLDRRCQLFDIAHQEIMLGAGTRDARDVAFLESVVADEPCGHLPGENHQRNGIHVGRGNAGDGVGGAGTGGDQANADLAGRAGVAVGGVHRSLLVPDQNMFEIAFIELIVNIQNCSARIAENDLHLFFFQHFQENLCAFEFHVTPPSFGKIQIPLKTGKPRFLFQGKGGFAF